MRKIKAKKINKNILKSILDLGSEKTLTITEKIELKKIYKELQLVDEQISESLDSFIKEFGEELEDKPGTYKIYDLDSYKDKVTSLLEEEIDIPDILVITTNGRELTISLETILNLEDFVYIS